MYVIFAAVIGLVMAYLPFIAERFFRADRVILHRYRRSYFILTTIAFEASLGIVLILGFMAFSDTVPAALRYRLGLAGCALMCISFVCALPVVVILLRTMRMRQQP